MSKNHKHGGKSHGWAWERARSKALLRDGHRCTLCLKAGRLEVHHLRALSRGGGNELSNLKTICRTCHIETHQLPFRSTEAMAWRELVEAIA